LCSPNESSLENLLKERRSWSWLKIKNWKEAKEEVIGREKSKTKTVFSKSVFC